MHLNICSSDVLVWRYDLRLAMSCAFMDGNSNTFLTCAVMGREVEVLVPPICMWHFLLLFWMTMWRKSVQGSAERMHDVSLGNH